jgi:DNA polymerase-3 subunit beta
MRFKVNKIELEKALNVVKEGLGKTYPILKNVLITVDNGKIIKFTAFNLKEMVSYTIISNISKDLEDGAVVVDLKELLDIVKTLPNIELEAFIEDNRFIIQYNDSQIQIAINLSPEEYPMSIHVVDIDNTFDITVENLQSAIDKVIFAVDKAGKYTSRPVLQGVLFDITDDTINIVGSDGYRMALYQTKINCNIGIDTQLVIPAKLLEKIYKVIKLTKYKGDIEVYYNSKNISFYTEEFEVSGYLVDGKYFDYKAVLPKEFNTKLIVNKKDFESMLKRMKAIPSTKEMPMAKIITDNNKIYIHSHNGTMSLIENMPAKITGDKVEIAFRVAYILDYLKKVGTKEVVINIVNSNSPVILEETNDNEKYQYLVMPVALN